MHAEKEFDSSSSGIFIHISMLIKLHLKERCTCIPFHTFSKDIVNAHTIQVTTFGLIFFMEYLTFYCCLFIHSFTEILVCVLSLCQS